VTDVVVHPAKAFGIVLPKATQAVLFAVSLCPHAQSVSSWFMAPSQMHWEAHKYFGLERPFHDGFSI